MCNEADPLREILEKDSRYKPEAYQFLFEALDFTQKMLGLQDADTTAERHVSGQQLVEGIRRLALEQFGPLAVAVFNEWGIRGTADFGEIVFNLVENQLMSKTEQDQREDFHNAYDFEVAFRQGYRISVDTDRI